MCLYSQLIIPTRYTFLKFITIWDFYTDSDLQNHVCVLTDAKRHKLSVGIQTLRSILVSAQRLIPMWQRRPNLHLHISALTTNDNLLNIKDASASTASLAYKREPARGVSLFKGLDARNHTFNFSLANIFKGKITFRNTFAAFYGSWVHTRTHSGVHSPCHTGFNKACHCHQRIEAAPQEMTFPCIYVDWRRTVYMTQCQLR